MSDGETVIPGEPLGVIEEYVPGRNVYIDAENHVLRSMLLGILKRNNVEHVIEVDPLKEARTLKKGDIVYGYLDGVRETIAFVKIIYVEQRNLLLLRPYSAVLPSPYISADPVKNIFNVYSYGDIIRAYVAEEGGPPYVISTRGREYGVVIARCPQCMSVLRKRGGTLVCPKCGVRVRKKMSIHYLIK